MAKCTAAPSVYTLLSLLCFILELIRVVLNIRYLVQRARTGDDTVHTTETSGQSASSLGLNGFNVVINLDSKSGDLTRSIKKPNQYDPF